MPLKKQLPLTIIFTILISLNSFAQIQDLINWLDTPPSDRLALADLPFAKKALTKNDAKKAIDLIIAEKQSSLLQEFGTQWDNRMINIEGLTMPFYYQIFGTPPIDGRSLFISLHGGGSVPAEVNDQQYQNQQHLYDATMNTLEGIYLAPRAPTNTWDLWHQSHIDDFLNIIIQLAILKENVNPNKVYLLGYSAGGDGVYQLAPRMADRWAAASMMAGHPNNASPFGLRNTPFAIHVGEFDGSFNRNGVALEWKQKLEDLQFQDSEGYIHQFQLHDGLGHWMNLQDAVALPWMHQFERNPIPKKVVWKQNNRHHSNFYWLGTPENVIRNDGEIVVEYDIGLNEINIIENYSEHLQLFLNDEMLQLEQPITIKYQGNTIFQGKVHRSILNLYKTLSYKGDNNLTFSTILSVIDNQTVREQNVDLSTNIQVIISSSFVESVYPNPTKTQLHVKLATKNFQDISFQLITMEGKLLKNWKTSQQINVLDIQGLPNGAYILKVQGPKESAKYKIIKH